MSVPAICIPPLSLPFFARVKLDGGAALESVRAIFSAADAGSKDPSNCKWIYSIPGGVIWTSKLAIDSDGREVEPGFRNGEQLDPADGQNQTSFHFADGSELDSEGCPYYVLPGGNFSLNTGLKLGDVGVVAYRDRLTAAVLGDKGPVKKIGEASIRTHKRLAPAAPDPCVKRDSEGRCTLIRNSSIEGGVIAFFFRGSAIPDLAESTAQKQIEERAYAIFRALGGVVPADAISA